MAIESTALLETRHLSKSFSSVRVLNDISISLAKGEILGVIGENGAGKSTFIKLISGIHVPTEGQVLLDGQVLSEFSPKEARRRGIVLIPQEFNLVNELTVYENIFLGQELQQHGVLLNKRVMKERTGELMAKLGVGIAPEAAIRQLSVAQKQMVEITKALAFDSRLLIMDEPTTVLAPREVEILFGIMRRLRDQGISIIFVSHKLMEVKTICDRVMVLRDGQFICLRDAEHFGVNDMVQSMVGRDLTQIFPPKRTATGDVLFRAEQVTVPGLLKNISFELRAGEVLGVAGLMGAGRTEMAETIMGIRRPSRGSFYLRGKKLVVRRPGDAVDAGISYLSEDRQGSGILTSFSTIQNVSLVSLRQLGFVIPQREEKRRAQKYVDSFRIKTPSVQARLEHLSGGNQQKVSLAKSIDTQPGILIVDEPTRGIDIQARSDIYKFIHELAEQGLACLLISSELEEIIGMCNRVLVMRNGEIVGEVQDAEVNEKEIMSYAMGVKRRSSEV